MSTQFVQVVCDVHVKWQGSPPDYRVYVNDELFAERTYIWQDLHLEEMLQISGAPGQYRIRYELVPPCDAQLEIRNMRMQHGAGRIRKGFLEILDASQ